ncbi:virulence factor Mce family protein [Actinokineospora alba]|uniref:Virulence factor Mce family protein n=1 Tax=Actinokineospora alba TaxID=504798 RepID=A0A1H0NIH1_9PSEU|nr:MCE family protein [Actinokineospora alba]TDP68724.1 virulence factor Mce-like protein [Actinokineospora alba]SDH85276.1 virulence factor Mce family protein [Actinokineospora alba]SDO92205.1 virulence factor Mce family protein [Actinokineospora alba]
MSNHRGLSAARYRVLGVLFVAVVVALIGLSVAVYRKTFTPAIHVNLETDRVGNQLRPGSDVKVRGVVVGEVRSVRSTGDKAVLDLALDPDRVHAIPDNVEARLLPKTLFGERYVSLRLSEQTSSRSLGDGDVIGQDRSSSAIEIERVLNDLVPVLQAVQPQKLSTTLTAIATALEGRGRKLGETLVALDAYLGEFEPALPDLKANITSLAAVADTYAEAAPELLDALADLTTTSRTFVEQRAGLDSLYGSVTTSSVDLRRFIEANRANMIALAAASRPTLEVLAKYAPEYPCFIKQFADAIKVGSTALGKGTEHPKIAKFTVEVAVSRGKYLPGVDTPRNLDTRGPRCYDSVPAGNFPQYPDGPVKDGSTKPPPPRSDGGPQGVTVPQSAVPDQIANSPQERDLIAVLLAPGMEVMPEDVPDWAALLLGPAFRGAEVTVR